MLENRKYVAGIVASVFTISTLWTGTHVLADEVKDTSEVEENTEASNDMEADGEVEITESEEVSKTTYTKEMLNATSNRYTRIESKAKVENRHNLDGYTKILEDSKIEIWHKDSNASIRIVNKKTGYIWGNLTEDKPEDMNSGWSAFGNSIIGIDYFDNKGIEKRSSIADKGVKRSYKVNGNKLQYTANFSEIGISFDFEVELKDGEIKVRLSDDSIKEEGKFKLASIYVLPFLGATRGDEIDGYMFIPDGSGALMRYKEPTYYSSAYDKRVYGKDFGIDQTGEANDLKSTSRPNDFAKDEPTIIMPVFGSVHGVDQNAVFARITEGDEYASIMATPSGVITNYNWISSKFVYRQKYLQPTSRNGAGIQLVQERRNNFNIEVSYSFLNDEDANYIGMAKYYRDQLKAEGTLSSTETVDNNIPVQLEVIATDAEKGLIKENLKEITSLNKVETILDELKENNIENVSLVIEGWQKGGVGGSEVTEFGVESKFANQKELKELNEKVTGQGGKLYYYYNPVTVNELQIALREEGSMTVSQALIKNTRDSKDVWLPNTYYVQPRYINSNLKKAAKEFSKNDMPGIAIGGLGNNLYSEGKTGIVMNRTEVKETIEEASTVVTENIEKTALYGANEYLWKYTDEMFNIPMVNSQYLFLSDTVPFIQMVLKGSMDYYAPFSNLSFYSQADILKMVEYAAYPSFLLTELSNTELYYTTQSELYSTRYEDWKEQIINIYGYINDALSKVEGKAIEDREVLSEGVVRIDYEGGTSIYVNYTDKVYKNNDVTIQPVSYVVKEGR